MQKDTQQAGEWQEIWERHNALDAIIDWGRSTYNIFFRRVFARYLRADSSVLELGSGRASLTLSVAKHIRKLVGVDITEAAVEQAASSARKLGITNATFILDDCTKLSLAERFDFVWSQGLLEHFEDPTVVVSEHYRMLAPGGVALMSVPFTYSYFPIWYWLTRPKLLRPLWPWTEQGFFTHKELLAAGKRVTPHARTFLLQPLFLGIIFLELKKPLE